MLEVSDELIQLQAAISEFFTEKSASPISQKTCNEKVDYFCERPDDMCLLRIVCMGNAERTVQGELLSHLRAQKWLAVSEGSYRVGTIDRHIDIMVHSRYTKLPLAAIELKHHSANQSSIRTLLAGMDEDYQKARCPLHNGKDKTLPSTLPLIQIGLFTEVTTAPDADTLRACEAARFYRFLLAYTSTNHINNNARKYGNKNTQVVRLGSQHDLIIGAGQCFFINCIPHFEIAGRIHILIHIDLGIPSSYNHQMITTIFASACENLGFS